YQRPGQSAKPEASQGAAGYRHGRRERQLLGSFGPVRISVPRARLVDAEGECPEIGGITPHPPMADPDWRPDQRGGRTPNQVRRCRPNNEPGAEDPRLVATI